MPYENYPSIKTIPFQPNVYNPIGYTPQTEDLSITERSLARIEARQEKAAEKRSAIKSAFGELKAKLHNDDETNKWIQDYEDEVTKKIDAQIQAGNFGEAARLSIDLAGDMSTNNGLLGRIAANAKYEDILTTQKQRLAKGEIDQSTFDWWNANNPYKYNESFDADGNELRGTLEDVSAPVDTLNIEKLWLMAAQMVEEDAGGSSGTKAYGVNGELTTQEMQNGTAPQLLKSGSSNWHIKREDAIRANMQALLEKPEVQRQLRQQFEVDTYEFKKLENKLQELTKNGATEQEIADAKKALDSYKPMMMKNGAPISSYEQWYDRTITNSPYGKNLSYNRTVTSSDISAGWGFDKTGNSGQGYGDNPTPGAVYGETVNGSLVEMETDTNDYAAAAGKAISDILDNNFRSRTAGFTNTFLTNNLNNSAALNFNPSFRSTSSNFNVGFSSTEDAIYRQAARNNNSKQ